MKKVDTMRESSMGEFGFKHLGTTITEDNTMKQDIMEKRAIYISKNNELLQELHFGHPKTKIWVNQVYNTSFYGAPLWDVSSQEYKRLEKTWNVSLRKMMSIPRAAHRYFLEPLSGKQHVVKSLKRRFLNFVSKVVVSEKKVLRDMLHAIRHDCRSVTGKNLRTLRLESERCACNVIVDQVPYSEVPKNAMWRVDFAAGILAIKSGDLALCNLSYSDLDFILEDVCCHHQS